MKAESAPTPRGIARQISSLFKVLFKKIHSFAIVYGKGVKNMSVFFKIAFYGLHNEGGDDYHDESGGKHI